MRKWMQDKLKRRKKSQEAAPNQPAPLQPAYFEPGQQPEAGTPPKKEVQEEPHAATSRANVAPRRRPEVADRESHGDIDGNISDSASGNDGDDDDQADGSSGGEGASEGASEGRTEAGTGSAAGDPLKGRPRRRRRGGRGRRRPGQKPTATPATSAPVAAAVAAEESPEPASVPPTSSVSRPRASKGTVILAIGLPGSGKSSWFKRHNLNPLSSDMIRALLFDDATEQRFQDLVFSNLRSMLRARLVARRPLNYVDATNLTPQERGSWIKLAKDFGYEAQAVYFDVPLEVCLERNHRRERTVEDDVMRKMAAKLKAPTFEEGFSKITVVRVKAKG